MGKGFTPVVAKPVKLPAYTAKLTPIAEIQANLSYYFSQIKDPRVTRTKKHLLKDILVIAILAVIAGAEGWEDLENYGIAKQEWLSEFLELPHGIPSDDTFRRLFERINPIALSECLTKCWAVPLSEFGGLYKQEQWSDLQPIVMVERTRHLWNKVTHEVQFYLSSLPADAQNLGNAIRTHWGIENQVHWTLDVTFNEDRCRVRSGNSPRNLALLRRMALNALNQEKSLKRSLRQKMKRAAMNNDYMMTVLQSFCQ